MVRGFWFKKLMPLHLVSTSALKGCIELGEVPELMVNGQTVLFEKDPEKGDRIIVLQLVHP